MPLFEASKALGKVYYLDGINNTLQVLDTRSGFLPESEKSLNTAPPDPSKTYLIDDFNQSFQLSADAPGVTSTSGKRNGLITPPKLTAENFYIADGFNNALQVSASKDASTELGKQGDIPSASLTLLADFFGGARQAEDVKLAELLPQVEKIASGELFSNELSAAEAQALFNEISQGPFNSESISAEEIIDNIGNPDRQLGWVKSLTAQENLAEGTEIFSLQRDVATENWKIGSSIQVSANDSEDVYIVDGFNSRLQVTRTSEGVLFTDSGSSKTSAGNFYLVDGINNAVEVSDAPDLIQTLFEGGQPANGLSQPLTLSSLVRQLNLEAKEDEDYLQVNGINNALELFTRSGQQIPLERYSTAKLGKGIAVDGDGNVYILNGINNRIRGLTTQSVPEKGSLVGLVFLGLCLYRLKAARTLS